MARQVVFVIGASGYIGKATVNALSSSYGKKVDIKAGVRDPDKAKALQSLAGVTVVQAEMGQREKLVEIFKGVNALLIVSPGNLSRVELSISTAEAAKKAGVKHIAVICGTSVTSPDKMIFGKQFQEIEAAVSNLGTPYTFIRLPFFFENFFAYQLPIKERDEFSGPVDADKTFSIVASEDAGTAAAAILVSPERHVGKKYAIVSDQCSFGEIARAFTKVLGREVKYVRVSYADSEASFIKMGVPKGYVEGFMEYNRLVNAGDPAVDVPNLEDFSEITGNKTTKLDTWITRFAPAFK